MLKLSNFQSWVLFQLFNDQNKHSEKDLLNACCESAIATLDPGGDGYKQQLHNLVNSKFIGVSLGSFFIVGKGIIYVRQNLSAIEQSCNDPRVPDTVEFKGNLDIEKAIRQKKITKDMILQYGLENIQLVRNMMEAVLPHVAELPK